MAQPLKTKVPLFLGAKGEYGTKHSAGDTIKYHFHASNVFSFYGERIGLFSTYGMLASGVSERKYPSPYSRNFLDPESTTGV
jgi:hypothetical protein